jgi:hypothetical protein
MVTTKREALLEAAAELARARVRFSEAFIMYRTSGGDKMTDRQAEAMAIIKTGDEVTLAQARLEIARRDLG